jgi:hypothetical protein
MTINQYPRGSEWRQWDLHIHSPASFEWSGEKLGHDAAANIKLIDQMIGAINASSVAAFALHDYWTFEGWFALRTRLAQKDAPTLSKCVFPGIELRLAAPMQGRLNAHVIFSDGIKDQYLRDFLSGLRLELINQPVSPNGLMEYARACGADKLKHHGFKKADVKSNDDLALRAGCIVAEINADSYKLAIRSVPEDLAVGFMPFTTNDGLDQVKWEQHYAFALGLFKSSPIFETREFDTWAAFAGEKTSGNKNWIEAFQTALQNKPRLAVSGSDAHRFIGVPGDNNARGYGQFPVGKSTWIKADPTWKGLLQTIKEPAKRSHLGDLPPKLDIVRQNKTFYIDRVRVAKVDGGELVEPWLDGTNVELRSL